MTNDRKKLRYIIALFAVVLCMAALPLTAYAGGGESEPEEPPTETAVPEAELNPFTPDGTGTVVDTATDEDGKLFFTITTPSENVFYLVIDQQRTSQNVYFLNAVTENDLLALAEPSGGAAGESAIPDEPAPVEPEPAAEPDPAEQEPEAEQEQGGGPGMIILAVVVILGAGGAGYYFKIYRPKQEAAACGDEYEGQEPDAEAWDDDAAPYPDDAAPYPDDEDAPPWEDGDNGPPWDEDEAEAREEYETDTGEGGDE